MKINKTIRQDILDILSLSEGSWQGELDDVAFLERIFDLDNLPSYDSRYDNARRDIYQHRLNNNDWEEDWIFRDNRFNILGTDDNTFLRFICETLHPKVRSNEEQVKKLLLSFNEQLRKAEYELVARTEIAGKPVYEAKRLRVKSTFKKQNLNITFYKVGWRRDWKSHLPKDMKYPCAVLIAGTWDDFNYKTSFTVHYFEKPDKQIFSGEIKIYKAGERTTANILPEQFTSLDDQFCSLGQAQKFYSDIKDLGFEVYTKILTSLNDVVFNPEIGKRFENEYGFKISLLRFSEAEKAFLEAGSLFSDKVRSRRFKFQFSTLVHGAEKDHALDFDFSPDKSELHRVAAIIGKNGTGKTQVLANFAQAMSGLKQGIGTFFPAKPSFSKVIALAYSVFDEFEKPPEGKDTFSYKYCGIKTQNEFLDESELLSLKKLLQNIDLNQEKKDLIERTINLLENISQESERLLSPYEIREKLQSALKSIKIRKYDERLTKVLEILLGRKLEIEDLWTSKGNVNTQFYDSLSSGQRILVLTISEVIANIVEESIILFDEPEIHLHPEAVSALARTLHLLLDEFDSYAIIATHSPIILQEIPSKFVHIFDREGNFPIVLPLSVEGFGENLTIVTEDVFHTSKSRNNYKDHLERLAQKYSFEDVLEIFNNQLGLNARSFLLSLYSE